MIDVYYSFNSGSNTTIQWGIDLGTQTARAIQVWTACPGTEIYCQADKSSGQFAVTASTSYIVRVQALAAGPGTFNICLQSPPTTPTGVFPHSGAAGAIPDNNTTGLLVNIPVSGVSGLVTDIALNLNGLTHTFVGDLNVQLTSPAGTVHNVFLRPGRTGADCFLTGSPFGFGQDLTGNYTFHDGSPNTLWNSSSGTVVPAAHYRTGVCGSGASTSLRTAFGYPGLVGPLNINGTWVLKVADMGGGDTGTLTGASLSVWWTAQPPCNAAYTAPANGSSTCSDGSAETLSWPAVATATGYDVYFDNAGGTTLVSSNQPGLTYGTGALGVGTYSWRIVPRNSGGPAVGPCPTWTFSRTTPPTWYEDSDSDGFGDPGSSVSQCIAPIGYVADNTDNCPVDNNPGQENADSDAFGDACDACPNDNTNDGDGDGVCEDLDNCPGLANPSQANFDGDSQGDACDPDDDNDGLSDVDEGTAGTNPFDEDTDDDGFLDGADNCPLVTGVVGSICDANPNPLVFLLGELDINCNCVAAPCTQNLVIDFKTDANPGEIGWELREQGTNTLVQQGLPGSIPAPNSPSYLVNTCVPNGCYYLKVTDTGGNGITNGGYVLRTGAVIPGSLPANMRIIDNRNNFTSGGTSQIQGPAPADGDFCFNGSSANLTQGIYTSCDKMDWVTGLYYVCSPVPAVAAQWNAGNTPAEAISGYEFWIYNPNGGYSFRRFRSHNVSDGFAPDNASRACHMKINNWAAANQIPANVLMNVRVRSRVNGTYYNWGPACRFMINPTQAACPLTNLMDIPGDPNLSCNSTRAWGNGNYIYARPVSGATQYQWRFRIDSESFITIRTTTTYFIQLNWATLPLQDGKTYSVEVRAFKGGAWCVDAAVPANCGFVTPCFVDWNPNKACLLTIDNTPFDGGDENSLEAGQSEGLRMYPNPNRGDQLYLSLDAVEEGVTTVSVDISDMFGKRVSARTIAVTDTFINTVLDLDGDMANGMYLVHITAGDKRYTERLVIQR